MDRDVQRLAQLINEVKDCATGLGAAVVIAVEYPTPEPAFTYLGNVYGERAASLLAAAAAHAAGQMP